MTKKQKKKAKEILDVIGAKRFADFYGDTDGESPSTLSRFLRSDDDAPTEEEVLKEIVSLFGIKNDSNS